MTINNVSFNAFDDTPQLTAVVDALGQNDVLRCGLILRSEADAQQQQLLDQADARFSAFGISGPWQLEKRRYALWEAARKVLGRDLYYIWQQTGSCVGAGGDNGRRTGAAVEIAVGNEPESLLDIWWPLTYGKSRQRGGLRGRGEGSFGPSWAEAATLDGCFQAGHPDFPELPKFEIRSGWLYLPASVEMQWSDGAAIAPKYLAAAKPFVFKTAAKLRSADEVIAALANGYAVTQASMFGFSPMVPAPRGTPAVRIASWNARWAHQTWVDEYWDHPTEGELFRWGNNWGPTAHGSPTAGEPAGGVYIRKATMDEICRTGDVYAFSSFNGFPGRARELNFSAF